MLASGAKQKRIMISKCGLVLTYVFPSVNFGKPIALLTGVRNEADTHKGDNNGKRTHY